MLVVVVAAVITYQTLVAVVEEAAILASIVVVRRSSLPLVVEEVEALVFQEMVPTVALVEAPVVLLAVPFTQTTELAVAPVHLLQVVVVARVAITLVAQGHH
jgi:hypothetical protein